MTEINDHEERVKEMAEALNMIPMIIIEDIRAEIIRWIKMQGVIGQTVMMQD